MIDNQFIYHHKLVQKSEKKTFKSINSFKVMQNAAIACYEYILKNYDEKKILILCGPGNNGGDGVLMAQHFLNNNSSVDINYPLGLPKTKDSKKAFKLLKNKKNVKVKISLSKYNLIIDAVFGTGFNKDLKPSIASFFKKINKSNAKIISIDMPSGVFTDCGQINQIAIKAHLTLSLHRFKPGQWLLPGKEYCGKNVLLDIGLANIDNECFLKLNYPLSPPQPSLADNKFSRGSCFIIAGENLVGASKLAFLSSAKSSLRAGAGLCKLLIDEKNANYYKSHILEEMILIYHNFEEFISIFAKHKCNSIIYGCGVENNQFNEKILLFLLSKKINLVLDATVFSLFKKNKKKLFLLLKKRKSSTVMTPHAGEFKRLFETSNDKIKDCLIASKQSNSIIVYKGNDTVISSPDGKCFVNTQSSPYLATAGSGDVLAGLIGGFLSQNINAIDAARLGCYIHSMCAINFGVGLTAGDLLNQIPIVIKKIINNS